MSAPASDELPVEPRPLVGGQAVIEGVLMRSPVSVAVVCRRKDGTLVACERPWSAATHGPRSWPLLRGVTTLVDSLRMGSRALRWSVRIYEEDLDRAAAAAPSARVAPPREPSAPPDKGARGAQSTHHFPGGALWTVGWALATLAGRADDEPSGGAPRFDDEPRSGFGWLVPLLMAIVLFVLLPQGVAELVSWLGGLDLAITSVGYQVITGAAKLVIVIGYLSLLRRVPEVRRVFEYHGAEHKSVSVFEAGEALDVDNARGKTTLHARCGTTFIVMVALLSILGFSGLGAVLPPLPGGRLLQSVGFFLLKLPLLPVVAALTFEVQRLLAKFCATGPLSVLLTPGFLVQRITTAEPDDAQLEVALGALRASFWRSAREGAPVGPDRVYSTYEELKADPGLS
jgi:uncharacterized protein YqhQ